MSFMCKCFLRFFGFFGYFGVLGGIFVLLLYLVFSIFVWCGFMVVFDLVGLLVVVVEQVLVEKGLWLCQFQDEVCFDEMVFVGFVFQYNLLVGSFVK